MEKLLEENSIEQNKILTDFFHEYISNLGFVKDINDNYERSFTQNRELLVSFSGGVLMVSLEKYSENETESTSRWLQDGILLRSKEEIEFIFERTISIASLVF